jgi:hypothetical protein
MSWRSPRSLRVVGAVRAARRLTRDDWTVLATAAVMLPAAILALKLVNLSRLLRAAKTAAGRRPPASAQAEGERVVRLVDAAAGWCVPRPTCLARALVAFVVLQRRAIPARFVLGIAKTRGALEGHAWVEVGLAPVAGRESGAFLPLIVVDARSVVRSEPAA